MFDNFPSKKYLEERLEDVAKRRGRRRRRGGRRSKAKATRRARIVLSKVGYTPSESKVKTTDINSFVSTTSDADKKNPDITVSYRGITNGIIVGTSDETRIGNTIYVKFVKWTYAFNSITAYRTSASSLLLPLYPKIHVFLVAIKCQDVATWWLQTLNGLNLKPDAFDTNYRKLRGACSRIIRHWKINTGRGDTELGSRTSIVGSVSHRFNTPIKVTYKRVASSDIFAQNQLAFIVYFVNDGDTTPLDSWQLHGDVGSGFHNLLRIDFMG